MNLTEKPDIKNKVMTTKEEACFAITRETADGENDFGLQTGNCKKIEKQVKNNPLTGKKRTLSACHFTFPFYRLYTYPQVKI